MLIGQTQPHAIGWVLNVQLMFPFHAAFLCREGGHVRALPLQYIKITAAMQLMRKAEEEMGQRFAFVVRPAWVDNFGFSP